MVDKVKSGLMFANLMTKKLMSQPEEDLRWFQPLIQVRNIQSDFFFEKYMVVGVSEETLQAAQDKSEFRENFILKPSILFRDPPRSEDDQD